MDMEKREKVLLVFLASVLLVLALLSASLVHAENDTTDDADPTEDASSDSTASTSDTSGNFESAYTCLKDLVGKTGAPKLSADEQAFSMLALAYDAATQGDLRTAMADSSNENTCWPAGGCRLKETALALIALNHINEATNLIENWLLGKTAAPSDLAWYLQIDADEKSSCTIKSSAGTKKVTVNEDKTISGGSGTCLKPAYNDFWLEISKECFDEEFEISCDKEFVTSVVYKKKSGSSELPYYISSVTSSAAARGITKEKINSLCFKQLSSSSCDYEGSLWAALALKKTGKDTSAYTPYLTALAPDYQKYLPPAFLFMLKGADEHFTELINEQKTDGYWKTSSAQSQLYYDTALGLLALRGHSAEQADSAINYLLEKQPASGCWNNIRDTAFILYAAAPKTPVLSAARADCADSGYYCASSESVCTEAQGDIKSNYYCSSLSKTICCSAEVEEALPDVTAGGEENECEKHDYYCKSFCSEATEESKPYLCSTSSQDCCGQKTEEPSSSGIWWLITLLVILIILVALAIIYRNQLRVWFFKFKNKFSKGPVSQQMRPAFPPGRPPIAAAAPRRFIPSAPMRPISSTAAKGPFPKEGALQDTLKKLRDMSR